VKHAGNHNPRCSTLDVHIEHDGLEHRGMDGTRHRPIDPPVRRSLVRFAAVQDRRKSVSLLAVSPLVDDGLTLAVGLVDRARPGVNESSAETIERTSPKWPLSIRTAAKPRQSPCVGRCDSNWQGQA
jgi:hypothetical protein